MEPAQLKPQYFSPGGQVVGVRGGDLVQDLVQRPGARSVSHSFSVPRPWSGQELPGALLAGQPCQVGFPSGSSRGKGWEARCDA